MFIVLESILLITWLISLFYFAGVGLQGHFIGMTLLAFRGMWINILILFQNLDLDSCEASPYWEAKYLVVSLRYEAPSLFDLPFPQFVGSHFAFLYCLYKLPTPVFCNL